MRMRTLSAVNVATLLARRLFRYIFREDYLQFTKREPLSSISAAYAAIIRK